MTGAKWIMDFPVTATSHSLADYRARGGYETLKKVLTSMKPEEVTKEVTASGLLGHGGAAFPVGRKWAVIKPNDGQPHHLCANADEGEPGTFKDRWVLEHAPHLLVESMLITSFAIGVRHSFVYIRGEFDLPYRRIQAAVDEAYEAGLLGVPLFGTGFALDLFVYRGAGSYVCGEASGLLTSIEGKKGYPRNRPPRLTVRGLYQRPTVVNNVETLANVTGIIAQGAEAFRKMGTAKSPGTQLVSISGHLNKPGVYEVEYGYPLAKFIYEDCGGILGGRKLKALIPGGISTKVLTGDDVAPLTYDHASFESAGSSLGSGGMIAIAEGTCMVRLLQVMLRFYHHESCGQCTPCREGTGWMMRVMNRMVEGRSEPQEIDLLLEVSKEVEGHTICALGDAAAWPIQGLIRHFRPELERRMAQHKAAAGKAPSMAAE
jgi:NADH-quinone oxidoreductase subunit F